MSGIWIIIRLIFYISVLSRIYCSWWDENTDTARVLYADGPARMKDYPHVVAIIHDTEGGGIQLMCGGSNIGTYKNKYAVVLTAGSCLYQIKTGRVKKKDVFVRSNSEYWNCGCIGGMVHSVHTYRLHPDYEEVVLPYIGAFSENDIGILILNGVWKGVYNEMALKSPINFNVESRHWKRARGTALGWGYTEFANETSEELRAAEDNLMVVKADICKMNDYKKYFPKHAFCIGTLGRPGKGPCAFDQGGPFFYRGRTSDKTYTLLGIASTGPVCSKTNRPTIVVNTSEYKSFIEDLSWIDDVDKFQNYSTGPKFISVRPPPAPITPKWVCRPFSKKSKICNSPDKRQSVIIKKNGWWYWIKPRTGVEDTSTIHWRDQDLVRLGIAIIGTKDTGVNLNYDQAKYDNAGDGSWGR